MAQPASKREVAAGDYDRSIHSNPSAAAWAKFFCETVLANNLEIDEGLMIGWFANAMMAMHDHVKAASDDPWCSGG